MTEAGIEVVGGVLESEGARLLAPYLCHVQRGRPLVTVKWAMTLDGRIASATGDSKWITSEETRRWTRERRMIGQLFWSNKDESPVECTEFLLILREQETTIRGAVLRQCLNKLKRSVHSEVTSKTKVQMTLIAKCPVLLCYRQLTFTKILLQMLQLEAFFTVDSFFEKKCPDNSGRPRHFCAICWHAVELTSKKIDNFSVFSFLEFLKTFLMIDFGLDMLEMLG